MSEYILAGQAAPASNTVYQFTPNNTKAFITSCLNIAGLNKDQNNSAVSIYLVPNGDTLSDKHTLFSNLIVEPKASIQKLAGLVIPVNASLCVKSDTGNVAFTLTGALI